jgi:O-antigen/teichoic acid export membrane protein
MPNSECRMSSVEAVTQRRARWTAADGPFHASTHDLPSASDVRHSSFRLSLRRNFAWTSVGNVVYSACQWGMLVVLAKLGSPEMVGLFAFGLAVTAPVILFSNLHLRALQATDAKESCRFGDYLALRLVTTGLAAAVIGGIALANRGDVLPIILAVGLSKAVESLSDVIFGLLQQHERMDRIAKSMILKGLASLPVLGVIVLLTGSASLAVLGAAAASAAVLVFYDVPSALVVLNPSAHQSSEDRLAIARGSGPSRFSGFRPRFHGPTLLRLVWLSMPLGLVMLLISLDANLPRYFIEHCQGERDLGIFAAIAQLATAGIQVIGALAQSASPRLARHYAEGDFRAFRRLLARLGAIGAAMGAAGVVAGLVAGREMLQLFYTADYAAYTGVFLIVMVAAGLNYMATFLGTAIMSTRVFGRLLLPHLLLTVLTATCAALWIPRLGLAGAAWTTVVLGAGSCIVPTLLLVRQLSRTP